MNKEDSQNNTTLETPKKLIEDTDEKKINNEIIWEEVSVI